MATTIGFVTSVYAGRAGLFTARIQTVSGTLEVQVSDLDGEPERFNERLLKTRIFRDAMNLAEPVEVTHIAAEAGGNEVEDVRRITRDSHHGSASAVVLRGFVADLGVEELDLAQSGSEPSDYATVRLLDPVTDTLHSLRLSMQMPERGVCAAILELLEAARRTGDVVEIRAAVPGQDTASAVGNMKESWIFAARVVSYDSAETVLDGFVESIGIRLVRDMALAEILFRTAPRLLDDGRVVDPAAFHPVVFGGMLPKQAPTMRLLEHALRDGLRVRIGFVTGQSERRDDAGVPREEVGKTVSGQGLASASAYQTGIPAGASLAGSWSAASTGNSYTTNGADPAGKKAQFGLVVGAVVMAPLASAARPVWLWVHQESLETPPEPECVPGLPLSDLTRIGVGSLLVPFRAAWEGEGCFNHGVYRIQVISPTPPVIYVDGEELKCGACYPLALAAKGDLQSQKLSSDSSQPAWSTPSVSGEGVQSAYSPGTIEGRSDRYGKGAEAYEVCMGHACLEGLHTVRIVLNEWRCGYRFLLDVFKIQ